MTEPLHARIADDLRSRIVAGEWVPGDPVPSETALCVQWQASRAPVRQALMALRAEGLIGGGRGKQPVVLTQVASQPFETFLSFSGWVRSLGRVPGQRTVEIALRPAAPEIAVVLGVDEGAPVVQLLRLRLIDERPAMLERSTFVQRVGRMLFDFDCDSGSIYEYLDARDVGISRAQHLIDALAADRVDHELLDVPEGAPLLRERRRASAEDGEPIEYSDDRYRPDMAGFAIENTRRARSALVHSTGAGLPRPAGPAT